MQRNGLAVLKAAEDCRTPRRWREAGLGSGEAFLVLPLSGARVRLVVPRYRNDTSTGRFGVDEVLYVELERGWERTTQDCRVLPLLWATGDQPRCGL